MTLINAEDGSKGAHFAKGRESDPYGSRAVLAKASGGRGGPGRAEAAQALKAAKPVPNAPPIPQPFSARFERAASRVRPEPNPLVTKTSRPALAGLVADLRHRGPA